MLLTMYMLISTIIIMSLLFLPLIVSKLTKKWCEKYACFECGVNLDSIPRKPFSIRFFLLMVLFIIFDLEIALILIMPMIAAWSNQMMFFLSIFFMLLITGISYEWKDGALNWTL